MCTCKQKRDAELSEHLEHSKLTCSNQTEQSGNDKMIELRNRTKISEHVGENQQTENLEQSENIKTL